MNYQYVLELPELSRDITEELLRYIYSDHVDNLDTLVSQLLSAAERYRLQGKQYHILIYGKDNDLKYLNNKFFCTQVLRNCAREI